MDAPENRFKSRLLAGDVLHGAWMTLASPVAAEALSLVGYDWLMFDTEHTPVDVAGVQPLLQAAAVGSAAVVRPAWNDPVLIKRVLDMGAQTLLIPFVQTPEEARVAVAATRYPPHGIRGVAGLTRASRFGLATDYFRVANREICVLVQIETGQALARLEEIATVEGVDGVFLGPSDLAASLGHLGQPGHPDVQTALEDAARRILVCGKAPGILATSAADARRYRGWGYRFIAAGVDLSLLLRAAQSLLREVTAEGVAAGG